ncbi:MAG: hypothetical protein QN174_04200 [Armatimonadota bacterium]|nr:hypothetical protein [Armatimonadota bacterium]MDR7454727.1 hypothetical protein [Armatimonadota bacterium]MDR7457312.1 hypothetical protein [Armatimonadota bacterium]MDR7496143.1 hypothetical protein [Armatimonadota bacterium]MDR7512709.1 hypothetical protein [Armatimonadota bacterium]
MPLIRSHVRADVVTVLDFLGPAAPRFEIHALLFLAAWRRHEGASRVWPLHVVCIGSPPGSVLRLAQAVGAHVVAAAPLVVNAARTSNKLRAFEVPTATGRRLVLDADTLVLKDLAPLMQHVGDGLGLGAATCNHFPEPVWREMYDAVGVPYPGPIGTCWCQDPVVAAARGLGAPQIAWSRATPPYFNSGVVAAPAASGLAERWWAYLERLVPRLEPRAGHDDAAGAYRGDEHALAIAAEVERSAGTPVRLLPAAFHARPVLLRAGVLRWEEVTIFHYHRALKPFAGSLEDLTRLVGDGFAAVPAALRAAHDGFYRTVAALHEEIARPGLHG